MRVPNLGPIYVLVLFSGLQIPWVFGRLLSRNLFLKHHPRTNLLHSISPSQKLINLTTGFSTMSSPNPSSNANDTSTASLEGGQMPENERSAFFVGLRSLLWEGLKLVGRRILKISATVFPDGGFCS